MQPGDLVAWKYRYRMDIPSEIGIAVERFMHPDEPFPLWRVIFPGQGVLQCRESDLLVVT